MRKIKVWGGMHPDEEAALVCVDSLQADPLPNVAGDIANPLARQLGRRMVDINLVKAFPGDPYSPYYEARRAAQVLQASQGYYAVIDLHNMNYFGENTGLIDTTQGVSPIILGFLADLGIKNLVSVSFSGLQKYVPNTLILETLKDGLGSDIIALRSAFGKLANQLDPTTAEVSDFRWFRHLTSLHVDRVTPDCLNEELRKNLKGFDQLPAPVAAKMGAGGMPAHLMSWRYTPNEGGYWGELQTPIASPDATLWPGYRNNQIDLIEFPFSTPDRG